jgi:hypothetical protein
VGAWMTSHYISVLANLLNFFEENEDEDQYEQQIGHRSPVTLENGYKPVITDFLCENETSDFSCDSSSSSNEDENQRFISTSVSGCKKNHNWVFVRLHLTKIQKPTTRIM